MQPTPDGIYLAYSHRQDITRGKLRMHFCHKAHVVRGTTTLRDHASFVFCSCQVPILVQADTGHNTGKGGTWQQVSCSYIGPVNSSHQVHYEMGHSRYQVQRTPPQVLVPSLALAPRGQRRDPLC
ncbi:uncharacterized protein [Dermacentor albipictus]|uniref:uncharacterized protein n=1 Tax=Dermacentor albipictus TaxID=60249 RepID=UPI0038FD3BE0